MMGAMWILWESCRAGSRCHWNQWGWKQMSLEPMGMEADVVG